MASNESSTDDYSANPVYTQQSTANGVPTNEITIVEHRTTPAYTKRSTADRVATLIGDVDDPSMQEYLKRHQFGEGRKASMSAVASDMINAYNEKSDKAQLYKNIGAIVVALLAISILSNLGTSWYAVEANKETKTVTTTYVPDELAHNNSNTTVHKVLTDVDGNPVRSDRSLDNMKLHSELPDEHWSNLKEIHIIGDDGALHFDVLGWARFQGERTRYKTVVVVYTIAGQVQFDGTAMTFNNDVAGAFTRAGFPVSSRRRGRQANDASGYTLTGIQEVFGAFNFIANLDVSYIEFDEDRPNITNNPFAGDVSDFYLVESQLYSCDEADRPVCPNNAEIIEIEGMRYYKREKHTRAKKVGGSWFYVARTTIPEAEFASKETGSKANVLVELSNGTHVLSYTEYSFPAQSEFGELFENDPKQLQCVWNRTEEKNVSPLVSEALDRENTDNISITFKGYDVVNGEYVRKYALGAVVPTILANGSATSETSPITINMYESYAERRLFSLGLFAPLAYTTYDRIVINPNSSVLQASNMPSLPSDPDDADNWLQSFTCPGGTGPLSIMHSKYDESAEIADEEEIPDIALYIGMQPYTDEAANNARLSRTLARVSEETEEFRGNLRHRRDTLLDNDEQNVIGFSEHAHRDAATTLALIAENATEFELMDICRSDFSCMEIFGEVSASCCRAPGTCSKCVNMLSLHREVSDTEMAQHQTDFALMKRGRRNSWKYDPNNRIFTCQNKTSNEFFRWNVFRGYYHVCRKSTSRFSNVFNIPRDENSTCPSHCRDCVPYSSSYLAGYCERETFEITSVEGGIDASGCLLCQGPVQFRVGGKVYFAFDNEKWGSSQAGGEIYGDLSVVVAGKRFADIKVFGGVSVSASTFEGRIYLGANVKFGILLVEVQTFMQYKPFIPAMVPNFTPTGTGFSVRACLDFWWSKYCSTLEATLAA